MYWGKTKENGIWTSTKSKNKFLFRNHDALFIALGRLRIRLMKPWM